VVFVAAKTYIPVGEGAGVAELDASHVEPIPGEPAAASYSSHLFDFWHPATFLPVLGVVNTSKLARPVGENVFSVTVTEYVRGAQRQSQVRCVTLTRP